MIDYFPDSWVVVKVKSTGVYKILAGWSGGYSNADSWRTNDGITKVEDGEEEWRFYIEDSSCYYLPKEGYSMRRSVSVIYNKIETDVELLPKDTDWTTIDWELDKVL